MVFFTSRGSPKPSTHIYGVEWDWTSSGPSPAPAVASRSVRRKLKGGISCI